MVEKFIPDHETLPPESEWHEVAEILRQELIRRREQALLDYMEACFVEAEDVLPVGDLLDKVKAEMGDEKMVAALHLVYAMQQRNEAVLYEDNDRQRIVVERLRRPDHA